MAKHDEIERRAEELIAPILLKNGVEIVDTEYVKEAGEWYLRYYIDKEGGVTIDDCENVSRAVSDLLDEEEDLIPDAYILEVSSPGLGRPIKKDRDLIRNLGKLAEIKLFKPLDGLKEFNAGIRSFDKTTVTLDVDGKELVVERKNIALMKEYFDWN